MTADYAASEKLSIYGSILFSMTEGGMNSFHFAWPDTFDTTDPGAAMLASLYDVTSMTRVETYSDLDNQQINLVAGGSYQFTGNFYMTAEAEYAKFTDSANDDGFVYGDQSGEYYRGNLGIGYRF